MKMQAEGLQLKEKGTPAHIFSCESLQSLRTYIL